MVVVMDWTRLEVLEKLTRKFRLALLFTLYEIGETDVVNLVRILGMYRSTVGKKVEELEGFGLIESEYTFDEEKKIPKKRVRLSEKGRRVVEILKELLVVLESHEEKKINRCE